MVEVADEPGQREGESNSVAAGNEAVYEVSGVQDLAPTCGAAGPAWIRLMVIPGRYSG